MEVTLLFVILVIHIISCCRGWYMTPQGIPMGKTVWVTEHLIKMTLVSEFYATTSANIVTELDYYCPSCSLAEYNVSPVKDSVLSLFQRSGRLIVEYKALESRNMVVANVSPQEGCFDCLKERFQLYGGPCVINTPPPPPTEPQDPPSE